MANLSLEQTYSLIDYIVKVINFHVMFVFPCMHIQLDE